MKLDIKRATIAKNIISWLEDNKEQITINEPDITIDDIFKFERIISVEYMVKGL